ncbi:MAG: GNAT family N-acetyltransferase [Flavobacteriales bacterium]
MGISIRRAEASDVPQMLALVQELATFEKEPEAVTVTEAAMLDAGFGKKPTWFGWVAVGSDDRIQGIAICYDRYSTWKGRCLYLEDIVVTESMRCQGIGDRLFRECVKHAVANHYHSMRWQVLDWNEGAIRFYKRMGADLYPGWLNGDLTKEQMQRLLSE